MFNNPSEYSKMFEPLTEQDRQDWQLYVDTVLNRSDRIDYIAPKETQVLKRRLDLHGMTVSEAHGKANNFIAEHAEAQTESVIIITGKSGQISYEFQEWCKQISYIRRVEPVIDSKGGIGSYRIWLKKRK